MLVGKIKNFALLLIASFSISLFAEESKSVDSTKKVTVAIDSTVKADSTAKTAASTVIQPATETPAAVLVITSEPAGAALLINDSVAGTTPLTLSGVKVGTIGLTLKMKGYYQKKAEVAVAGTDTQKVNFVLLKPASIFFTSTPSGAQVSINDIVKGNTPLLDNAVKPGENKISLSLANHQSIDTTFQIGNGSIDTLSFKMVASPNKNVGASATNSSKNSDSTSTSAGKPQSNLRKYSGIIGAAAFAVFAIILLAGERKDL